MHFFLGAFRVKTDGRYDDVLCKLVEKFFPIGRNEKGRIEQFETRLGTAKQRLIDQSFRVGDYCVKTANKGRNRDSLINPSKLRSFFSLGGTRRAELNNLKQDLAQQNRDSLINPSELETIV